MSQSEGSSRFPIVGRNSQYDPAIWETISELFMLALESEDPESLLAREPDPTVAAGARHLWTEHQRAELTNFLAEPAIDLGELDDGGPPIFSEDELVAGRFRIQRLLGRGGMGEVYLARDEHVADTVALKTILAELAPDPAFRAHLMQEVRSARYVTHHNVCRIFDAFEANGVPFYTMEFIPGIPLSEWLSQEPAGSPTRLKIAVALARGLHAAHEQRIIHRDFKPGNVIVRPDGMPVITDFGLARPVGAPSAEAPASLGAGTVRYMAPELRAGEMASVATDIYAFGAVLEELLPGNAIARECLSAESARRPATMQAVIDRLDPQRMDRRLLVTVAALAATTVGTGVWHFTRSAFPLASQQRVILNGIRSTIAGETPGALRELLLLALRQSPMLRIVSDVRVRALLRQGKRPNGLPAAIRDLMAAASLDRIPLILEVAAQPIAAGLQLAVSLFANGEQKPAFTVTEEAPEAGQLVKLAERVAARVRGELGESGVAMKANIPLEQVTSASVEAVQLYYRAVRAQDKNELEVALAYLDEALRLDPDFAVAHHYRGVTLVARSRYNDAVPSLDRAFALRGKLQERERNWIESQRYMLLGDPERSLIGCGRNAALYPDEPAYQRQMAAAYSRLGNFDQALPYCRRAAELDPFNDNNLSELVVTLAESNRGEEALVQQREFRKLGNTSRLLEWGAGQALLGLGRYEEAAAAFERMGAGSGGNRWASLLLTIPMILRGDWTTAEQTLEADLAHDDAMQEQNRRHTRRLWLAELAMLRDRAAKAHNLLETLFPLLEQHAGNLEFFHHGAVLSGKVGDATLSAKFLAVLQELDRKWGSTHTAAAVAHARGVAEGDVALLRKAKSLWPHPPVLLSCGLAEMAAGAFPQALGTLEWLERQRGKIFKHYFPGVAVSGWRAQGQCLQELARFEDASRMYERVNQHWGGAGGAGTWQREFLADRKRLAR